MDRAVVFSSTPSAELTLSGTVFAQACQQDRCLAPKTYEFRHTFVSILYPPTAAPARVWPAAALSRSPPPSFFPLLRTPVRKPKHVSQRIGDLPAEIFAGSNRGRQERIKIDSDRTILLLAFVAGFLLNLMPCVLPVVGLKLLSFVQQSNHSRRRALLLNVAYSAGLMSVMLVLAMFAVFAGLGWGEQFSSTTFSVTLAAIVFAFGLSFLGIWEIPAPGSSEQPEALPAAKATAVRSARAC